jgi:competence protein ComGC
MMMPEMIMEMILMLDQFSVLLLLTPCNDVDKTDENAKEKGKKGHHTIK